MCALNANTTSPTVTQCRNNGCRNSGCRNSGCRNSGCLPVHAWVHGHIRLSKHVYFTLQRSWNLDS